RTIMWWAGRMKTLHVASAVFRTGPDRKKFIQAVAAHYPKLTERRIYEGLSVYKRFSKPSDSLQETCQRIFQEVGSWSNALPAKKEKEVEQKCKNCFHCPRT